MSRADQLRVMDYLRHILEAIERIDRYVGSMDEEEFLRDEKTQDAVIRNFEIIGEASRNIERYHPGFAAEHAEVPWGIAYEMRNALAHGYFMVDNEIVWKTIRHDLPGMSKLVSQLAESLFLQPER
jgi:uncharacterized protein with HEPN domain